MEDFTDNKRMDFFSFVDELKEKHKSNTLLRGNGTLLLNPGKIPKAQHIIRFGTPERNYIKRCLVDILSPIVRSYLLMWIWTP